MGKVAFVFPGQASQYPGMGKELAEKYAVARAVLRLFAVREQLHHDLRVRDVTED